MITVENRAGRLIEVRFAGELTPAEMKDMRTPLSAAIVKIGVDVLFAVDFRTCGTLSTDVLPMMLGLMRSDNRKILKSAHLFPAESAIAKQMEVAIADAANPRRRAFFDREDLVAWLANLATADEIAQARTFFS